MGGTKFQQGKIAAFRLRRWTIFPDRLTLAGPAGSRSVEAMSMRLLLALSAKAPETLTRDQIIDAVWDGRVVTDDAINKQVSKLRTALADPADSAPLVQTVPKVGVRLIESPRPLRSTAARSVAILYCLRSWQPEQSCFFSYFCCRANECRNWSKPR